MQRLLAFLLLAALAMAAAPRPQNSPADHRLLWVLHRIEVAPAQQPAFEAVWRERAGAARQAGLDASSHWYLYKEDGGRYAFAVQVDSFNDLDQPQAGWRKPLERAVGAAAMAAWDARERAATHSAAAVVALRLPDLSYEPPAPDAAAGVHFQFTFHYVRPDRLEAYRRVLLRFREALARTRYPHRFDVFEMLYGEAQAFALVGPESGAGASHEELLVRAFGPQQGAGIAREWRECLRGTKSIERQLMPELSFFSTNVSQ